MATSSCSSREHMGVLQTHKNCGLGFTSLRSWSRMSQRVRHSTTAGRVRFASVQTVVWTRTRPPRSADYLVDTFSIRLVSTSGFDASPLAQFAGARCPNSRAQQWSSPCLKAARGRLSLRMSLLRMSSQACSDSSQLRPLTDWRRRLGEPGVGMNTRGTQASSVAAFRRIARLLVPLGTLSSHCCHALVPGRTEVWLGSRRCSNTRILIWNALIRCASRLGLTCQQSCAPVHGSRSACAI
mmetsp:Transcript_17827/g.49435  ORF Transcript_17827/g.49435 Transcript_17827/m.49435 type:complete len:240 (-) Transcript_17827:8-727(-)